MGNSLDHDAHTSSTAVRATVSFTYVACRRLDGAACQCLCGEHTEQYKTHSDEIFEISETNSAPRLARGAAAAVAKLPYSAFWTQKIDPTQPVQQGLRLLQETRRDEQVRGVRAENVLRC